MFANLSFVRRCMQCGPPLTCSTLQTLTAAISSTSTMLKDVDDDFPPHAPVSSNLPHSPVVDIDVEKMMYEDEELSALFRIPAEDEDEDDAEVRPTMTKTLDQNGIPLAPVDIDPWVEEEEVKQGTVEVERCVDPSPPIVYPPIPPASERSGTYQFKGIKVVLPKRMLNPSTYRYRLDPEDQAQLADDIRICKFDK